MSRESLFSRQPEILWNRYRTTAAWLADFQADPAARRRATRELFGDAMVIFDPHTHSTYSDGRGTIAMNREAGRNAGLNYVRIEARAVDHRRAFSAPIYFERS